MSMQDNDIDELFRSKLNDLEVKPADKVWKGIALELDGKKSKRTLMPVIRIAASITIFIAAGLFFLLKNYKEDEDVTTITGTKTHLVKSKEEGNRQAIEPEVLNKPAGKAQQIAATGVKQTRVKQRTPLITKKGDGYDGEKTLKHTNGEAIALHATQQVDKPKDELPASAERQIVAAAGTGNDLKIAQAVVPDESLTMAKPVAAADDFKTADKIVTARLTPAKPAKAKKHGIRSFGDLINVVVAQVDKREDKVIEFSNTDDDEATITGINLGIVKVKKDK